MVRHLEIWLLQSHAFGVDIFSWLTDPSSVYPFIPCSSPCFEVHFTLYWGFPGDAVVKNLPAYAGDMGLIPEWGRAPREGTGNPLKYSCLENPMEEAGRLQSMGWKRVWHNWAPNTLPYINVITSAFLFLIQFSALPS